MMIIFCTAEEEQQLDTSHFEGHIPRSGDYVVWKFQSSLLDEGVYRVDRVEWHLGLGTFVRVHLSRS